MKDPTAVPNTTISPSEVLSKFDHRFLTPRQLELCLAVRRAYRGVGVELIKFVPDCEDWKLSARKLRESMNLALRAIEDCEPLREQEGTTPEAAAAENNPELLRLENDRLRAEVKLLREGKR